MFGQRRRGGWPIATHPDAFSEELEQALKIIATLPGAGSTYSQSPSLAFDAFI